MFTLSSLPRIPLADWIDQFVDWLTVSFGGVFNGIASGVESFVDEIVQGLGFVPPVMLTVIFAALVWLISKRGIALFTLIGFFIIDYLGYWDAMLQTLALVVTSVLISVIIGIPVGIWGSQRKRFGESLRPSLT